MGLASSSEATNTQLPSVLQTIEACKLTSNVPAHHNHWNYHIQYACYYVSCIMCIAYSSPRTTTKYTINLPSSLCFHCTGTSEKTKSVLSEFITGSFGYSLSIYHVCKLTGLTTSEAKELRLFLSDKRVNK